MRQRTRGGTARAILAAAGVLCAAAATAAAEEPAGSPYGDLGQAFIALAVFAVILVILGKYAWKPVIGQLQRREEEIGARLRDSERREQEAKELEAEYRARLDRAETEAKQVLAQSLEEAAKAREEMLAAAREEGSRSIEAAKEEIEQFKRSALEDLQQSTANLAVEIAGELLHEELNPPKQKQLMERSLARIRSRAESEAG